MPITKVAASSEVDLTSIRLHLLDWDGVDPPVLLLHPNRTNERVTCLAWQRLIGRR